MLKLMIGVVIVIGVVLVVVYQIGISDFDPTAQGEAAMKTIKPGMTWEQVIDATKAPRKFTFINVIEDGGFTSMAPGMPRQFNQSEFEKMLDGGSFKNGFVFIYNYSPKAAFDVIFSPEGKVESLNLKATIVDLLHTR